MTGFHLFIYDLSPMLLAAFLVLGAPQWKVKSPWRLSINSALVIMFIPLVYLLRIRWGRIYLLWIAMAAFVVGVFGTLNGEPSGRLPTR
jgi:multisubunit Na+/H+ antiporter MnhF subunit